MGTLGGSDPQSQTLHRFLDANGDGSGVKNAIGDQSGPVIYYIQPPIRVTYNIFRLLITIEDGSCRWDRYGGLATALINGIQVRKQNDEGTLLDLTDGVPIKTNSGWGRNCFDCELNTRTAGGNDFYRVRWTFAKSGQCVQLNGDSKNERLEVVLDDNFSGLVQHYFKVEGFIQ